MNEEKDIVYLETDQGQVAGRCRFTFDQEETPAGIEPAWDCFAGSCLTFWLQRRIDLVIGRDVATAQGFEPCPTVLEAVCSPRSTPLYKK